MTGSGPDPVTDEAAAVALLADLAADDAPHPPARLRSAVLAVVRADQADEPWPEPESLPGPARPLARQAAALDRLLAGLGPDQWGRPVLGGWSAAQLVGHLLAVDGLCAGALGLPVPPEAGADRPAAQQRVGGGGQDQGPPGSELGPAALVERRTAAVFRALAGDPVRTRRAWRGQLVAVLRHAAVRDGLAAPVDYLGLPLSAADVLLDRGFETWVHAEDLRTALDLPGQPPDPQDAHRLADLGLRMLPLAWPAGAPGGAVEVLLTGPGGGRWTVPVPVPVPEAAPAPEAASSAPVAGTVELDVVDFCRLAGGRLDPVAVPHRASGDPGLTEAALVAAAALARL